MPAPIPYPGQSVLVQDLMAEPAEVKLSPGIIVEGFADGSATIFAMTAEGFSVISECPWDDTSADEASPDKCWRLNWVTP